MLYTITIKSDTKSVIDVDDTYTLPNDASCQGYDYRNHNCNNRAECAINVNAPKGEYIAQEIYCEDHIGTAIVNLLQPEPNCC